MKLTLTWCTRYNGIHLSADEDWVTDMMEEVFEKVSDTLPTKTYGMTQEFEDAGSLTENQEQQLIDDAKEIIKEVIPNAEITFEYDEYSS